MSVVAFALSPQPTVGVRTRWRRLVPVLRERWRGLADRKRALDGMFGRLDRVGIPEVNRTCGDRMQAYGNLGLAGGARNGEASAIREPQHHNQ